VGNYRPYKFKEGKLCCVTTLGILWYCTSGVSMSADTSIDGQFKTNAYVNPCNTKTYTANTALVALYLNKRPVRKVKIHHV